MNSLLISIILIIIILSGYLLYGFYKLSKIKFLELKINEAIKNLDIIFDKKIELLSNSVNMIKSVKGDDIKELEKVLLISSKKINMFDINKELSLIKKVLDEYIDLNKDLLTNDSFKSLITDIDNNDEELSAVLKFYNDISFEYNAYLNNLLLFLIYKMFSIKEKELFIVTKKEDFAILK